MSNIKIEMFNDEIAEIVLDKPQRKNAIDLDMMVELNRLLLQAERDKNIRVVILKGRGENFSSGADLKAAPEGGYSIDEKRACLIKYNQVIKTILSMEKPVISSVRGYAVGGAMSLALACDIIFAAEDAKFFGNFVKVGIVPEMGAMMILPHLIGANRAKEIWFSGQIVDGKKAYDLGIANRVCKPECLEQDTIEFAKALCDMPQTAMGITKRVTNATMFAAIDQLLETEQQASPFCGSTEEFKLRREKFLQKGK